MKGVVVVGRRVLLHTEGTLVSTMTGSSCERLKDIAPMFGDSEVTAVRPDHDSGVANFAGHEIDIYLLH